MKSFYRAMGNTIDQSEVMNLSPGIGKNYDAIRSSENNELPVLVRGTKVADSHTREA